MKKGQTYWKKLAARNRRLFTPSPVTPQLSGTTDEDELEPLVAAGPIRRMASASRKTPKSKGGDKRHGGERKPNVEQEAVPEKKKFRTTPRFLDERGLAKRWRVSLSLVRKLRYHGDGPAITFIGRAVRYKLSHVLVYERANKFRSASDRDAQRTKRP